MIIENGPPPEGAVKAPSPGMGRRLRAHAGKAAGAGLALLLGLALVFADALLAGPMRGWAERAMNARLKGYALHIARVRPHLWRIGFDLDKVVLVQNSHPDPPVADFGALRFSLAWAELRHFKVAGNLAIVSPALHINLAQIQAEAASQVSLKDQGWQSAVESVYPIKLDQVMIQDGSLLYLSAATASKPLQLTRVSMVARNVRNKAAVPGTFPSPVTLEGVLFDSGTIRFTGAADFLREPYVAARGEVRLERVPLDRLTPLAQDYQLKTTNGLLSLNGMVEYTPEAQAAHLAQVLFEDLRVDYITSKATRRIEAAHARQAKQIANNLRNAPRLALRVDTLRLKNSQIGFVNQAVRPPYRVFMSGVDLELANLSNQANDGRSTFKARGAFMGSGATMVSGGIRGTARPADFDVHLKMKDARLPALNPLFLAYSGVDVAEGQLSLFSEIKVKDGRVNGYFKPLIKHLKIYDKQKDQDKPFGKRVKMHLLQFLAYLFKNRSSQEVATVVRLSGPTSDPKASEWEVIRRLIGNGFARAVLPGFMGPADERKPAPAAEPKPQSDR